MRSVEPPPASVGRVFVVFAVASLLVVALMGVVLATTFRAGADARGLSAARQQAELIATSTVEPALSGQRVGSTVDPGTRAAVSRVADRLIAEGRVLRLRLRAANGAVAFTADGTGHQGASSEAAVGEGAAPAEEGEGAEEAEDDEALEAAQGEPQAHLTRLNADLGDTGGPGVRAVEVYQPLGDQPVLGVLEMYLPYAPIEAEVQAGVGRLYSELTVGLSALYLVLLALGLFTTRRLRQHAARNAWLAEHDGLTGLANRRGFLLAIERVVQSGQPSTVAVLDLDRFKEVNDALGPHNGDALLMALAVRLQGCVSPDDVVARLGGDEFGLVLAGVGDERAAGHVLADVVGALGEPIELVGIGLESEASVGYVITGEDGDDADTLLRRADVAMYAAKGSRQFVVRYDAARDRFDPERLALVGELGRAIAHDELVLHFQPKVDLRSGDLLGLEALLRWQHPRHGLLAPDAFLPLAEQTGLIDPLTDWVLDRALAELAAGGLPSSARVSVNVSARNLEHELFAERVLDALGRHGVPSGRLILEITETAVLADLHRATELLQRLSDCGVSISLDDFGQGQTSLGYLSRLHLSELKIDRSFVAAMLADPASAAIVRSMVQLGHDLGLSVVAEGIEDEPTREALRALGCDEGQGFGLARPMPADRIAGWLAGAAAR